MNYEEILEEIEKYLNDIDDYEDEAVELSNLIDRLVIERRRRKNDN